MFHSGPESVSAALLFAIQGVNVHLLGHHRDELDEAGRQIITAMDSLVHQGKVTSDERFKVYSRLQKRVYGELPEETALYLEAAPDDSAVKAYSEYLHKRGGSGLALCIRRPGSPVLPEAGLVHVVRLECDGDFAECAKVRVHLPEEAPPEMKDHVGALLGAIQKEVVFD